MPSGEAKEYCSHFARSERPPAREARRLLNLVLSNCSRGDGEVVATFRNPLELSTETATVAVRPRAAAAATPRNIEIWLGDLDSNQGCPGQSREFYR